MPAIDQINLQSIVDTTNDSEVIRSFIKQELWQWYDEHKDDVVRTVNFWIIHRTIYVRDFHDILVLLLGPEQ